MSPQDIHNFSSWLQEIVNTLRDTHTQLQDLRAENRQMMDDLRAIASRVDQKDTETLKSIEALKGQLDILRVDVGAAKNAAEHATNSVDSKMSDLKSALNDIKRAV